MRQSFYLKMVNMTLHLLAIFLPKAGVMYAVYFEGFGRLSTVIFGDQKFIRRVYGTTGNIIQKAKKK